MAASEQDSPPTAGPSTDPAPQDLPPAPKAALPRRGFHDLTKRTVTAAILLGIALTAIWQGGPVFTLLVFAALALLLWEWADMALPFPDQTDKIVGTVGMTALLASALLFMLPGILGFGALPNGPLWVFGVGVAIAWAASFRLRWPRTLTPGAEQVHASIGDLLNYYKWATWFAPAIIAVLWLRHSHGAELVVWLFIVIWATDIGAYVVGRIVGGPKLAPAISPGKTWSGAVGGLAIATAAGVLSGMALAAPDIAQTAWIALLIAFIGMIGDIAQSAFKRAAGVKDSGSLLPGHGGVFDRLDSMLAALPLFAVLIWAGKSPL